MAKQKHPFHALNKRELLHLMDSGVHDLAGFKRTAKSQAIDRKMNAIRGWGSEPCWECRAIAQKLDIPVFIKEDL